MGTLLVEGFHKAFASNLLQDTGLGWECPAETPKGGVTEGTRLSDHHGVLRASKFKHPGFSKLMHVFQQGKLCSHVGLCRLRGNHAIPSNLCCKNKMQKQALSSQPMLPVNLLIKSSLLPDLLLLFSLPDHCICFS